MRSSAVAFRQAPARVLRPRLQCRPRSATFIARATAFPLPTVEDASAQARLDALMQKFMDEDSTGNGMLDKQQLRHLLESVGGEPTMTHWIQDDELNAIFNLYDKDGNQSISFDEFVLLAEDGVLLEHKVHEYEAVFHAMDTDGNGTLSATELSSMFKQLGITNMGYQEVISLMAQYDVDKNGAIDFHEFLRMFRSQLLDLHDVLEYLGMPPPLSPKPKGKTGVTLKGLFVKAPACAPGTITNIFNEAELDAVLHQHARDNKLVVIMAGMTFCGACKAFLPSYLNLAKDFKDVVFLKFYGNSNEDTKNMYKKRFSRIRTLPAFQFYRNMAVVDTVYGAKHSRVEEALHQHAPRAWQHGLMSALGL